MKYPIFVFSSEKLICRKIFIASYLCAQSKQTDVKVSEDCWLIRVDFARIDTIADRADQAVTPAPLAAHLSRPSRMIVSIMRSNSSWLHALPPAMLMMSPAAVEILMLRRSPRRTQCCRNWINLATRTVDGDTMRLPKTSSGPPCPPAGSSPRDLGSTVSTAKSRSSRIR